MSHCLKLAVTHSRNSRVSRTNNPAMKAIIYEGEASPWAEVIISWEPLSLQALRTPLGCLRLQNWDKMGGLAPWPGLANHQTSCPAFVLSQFKSKAPVSVYKDKLGSQQTFICSLFPNTWITSHALCVQLFCLSLPGCKGKVAESCLVGLLQSGLLPRLLIGYNSWAFHWVAKGKWFKVSPPLRRHIDNCKSSY